MPSYQHKLYSEILSELRSKLIEAKVTQKNIGEYLGVSQASISALLSGKSRLSVDQLLGLCELAGSSLQSLGRNAEVRKAKFEKMSKEMEDALYRSDIHLILYCASVQEIDFREIKIGHLSQKTIETTLMELVKVGLLERRGNKFIQKAPHITYVPLSLRKNMEAHLKVLSRSVKKHLEILENKDFKRTRFNWSHIDRFTTAQIKEMESACWRVYEKFDQFQKQNALINYVIDEPMDLWNLHVMIMPILD